MKAREDCHRHPLSAQPHPLTLTTTSPSRCDAPHRAHGRSGDHVLNNHQEGRRPSTSDGPESQQRSHPEYCSADNSSATAAGPNQANSPGPNRPLRPPRPPRRALPRALPRPRGRPRLGNVDRPPDDRGPASRLRHRLPARRRVAERQAGAETPAWGEEEARSGRERWAECCRGMSILLSSLSFFPLHLRYFIPISDRNKS